MNGGLEGQGKPPSARSGDGTFAPVRLSAARPPIGRWLAVALIGLSIIVAKPWGAAEPEVVRPGSLPTGPLRSPATPQGLPSPTIPPDSAGPLVSSFCLDPRSWRVATTERWRDQTIRVWRAIDPATRASGPDDPRIPTFPIVSEGITELGWCAPVVGPDRPSGVAAIRVWLRSAKGSNAMRVSLARPVDDATSFGALYLPPGAPVAEVWKDGTYVFRYQEPAGRERWFAIEVELRPSTGKLR
jgi:hypothetical protein